MDALITTAVIVGMFVLRLGIPLAIIFVVGYLLRRLDARWQAKTWAQWEANRAQPLVTGLAPPHMVRQPCWARKGCTDAQIAKCTALRQPSLPCWLARAHAEGRLPAECHTCEIFAPKHVAQRAAG